MTVQSKPFASAGVADRLGKLIPRLASDHDGEVVATVAAIGRTLRAPASTGTTSRGASLPRASTT